MNVKKEKTRERSREMARARARARMSELYEAWRDQSGI